MSTCSNAAGQPYGSANPQTYLQAQLDKITKPAQNRAAPATTSPAESLTNSKNSPLNASGRGQLLNTTA